MKQLLVFELSERAGQIEYSSGLTARERKRAIIDLIFGGVLFAQDWSHRQVDMPIIF